MCILFQEGVTSGLFLLSSFYTSVFNFKKCLASGSPLNVSLLLPPEFVSCFSWFKSLGMCDVKL